MNYLNLREEALKNAIREDFFSDYNYTQIGNIDFVICRSAGGSPATGADSVKSILWAEAKQGKSHDIFESFVQLILTIGKEKTFEKYLPPKYIGAFDAEKFAFIEYHKIQHVFYQNDFNWNVAPSNHETKEFKQLHALCERQLSENSILFKYASDSKELQEFIKLNFKSVESDSVKISVTKNNFVFVFQKWCESVKDSIFIDWKIAQKSGIIPADFFLADLLSENNESLKENLFVVLKKTKYELAKKMNKMGLFEVSTATFLDNQKAHREFWAIYERPPKEEYWDYIIGRRDLLVPQDIRERKGAFFTPQIWVEKSQEYLADVLGENWQDEYYIWDCCAGTGNLLNGLTNKYNIFASTLDQADVDVMHDRIKNGANLLENHIFQFDFLNDEFSAENLPQDLYKIISDPQKLKKLVIYINPPYAETDNRKTDRSGVKNSQTLLKYNSFLKNAGNELYAQFLIRIYFELRGVVIAQFSKLKHLQAPNFKTYRSAFTPKLKKMFAVPGNSFDNVKGSFPIGFMIWQSDEKHIFRECESDFFDSHNNFICRKKILSYDNSKLLNDWISEFKFKDYDFIGLLNYTSSDFQQQKYTCLINGTKQMGHNSRIMICSQNILQAAVYFAVRLIPQATWLNDRDQFLYPNDGWENDTEFQSNCLIFMLFHGQNRISAENGTNHWIPFSENEVGSQGLFDSHFMSEFLAGKNRQKKQTEVFESKNLLCFSDESKKVIESGKNLWRYYHSKCGANPNAALYDIKFYFQGKNDKTGEMNSSSGDEKYTALIQDLRAKMKVLAAKIAEKVYEYGFLK